MTIKIFVSPRTAEDLNKTGNDDEKSKSKNPTSIVKHHLKERCKIRERTINILHEVGWVGLTKLKHVSLLLAPSPNDKV